jgi:hypothetical protein
VTAGRTPRSGSGPGSPAGPPHERDAPWQPSPAARPHLSFPATCGPRRWPTSCRCRQDRVPLGQGRQAPVLEDAWWPPALSGGGDPPAGRGVPGPADGLEQTTLRLRSILDGALPISHWIRSLIRRRRPSSRLGSPDRTVSSSPRNWFSCHRCSRSGASDQGLLQRRIDAAVAAVMAVHRAAELAGAGWTSTSRSAGSGGQLLANLFDVSEVVWLQDGLAGMACSATSDARHCAVLASEVSARPLAQGAASPTALACRCRRCTSGKSGRGYASASATRSRSGNAMKGGARRPPPYQALTMVISSVSVTDTHSKSGSQTNNSAVANATPCRNAAPKA